MKRIKIIRVLATYICHDPFAYSPIWTWDGFPPIIYTERERILPVLKEWEHKGYLTLIYDEVTIQRYCSVSILSSKIFV